MKLEKKEEASKQDGHIEETHVTSTLNINDSRDVNDVNGPGHLLMKFNAKKLFLMLSKKFQQTAVPYNIDIVLMDLIDLLPIITNILISTSL
jgi:hypothetical protein